MMPSMAAGIPPGVTLTIPGGYLEEGQREAGLSHGQRESPDRPRRGKEQQRDSAALLELGLVLL